MRTFPLLFLVLCIAACLTACSEDAAPAPESHRYVYCCVQSPAAEAGFYRYGVSSGAVTKMDPRAPVYCTRVAANGIVLFDIPEIANRLYGLCEDQSIIPVPFPVPGNAHERYDYALPPEIALAGEGHHAAYPVVLMPEQSQNPADGSEWLMLFDCGAWQMTLIPADSIIAAALGTAHGIVTGRTLCIGPDGGTLWFAGAGVAAGAQPDTAGYALFQWTAGGTAVLQRAARVPYALLGYNAYTHSLLFAHGDTAAAIALPGGAVTRYPFPAADIAYPHQVSAATGALVRWHNNGLETDAVSGGALWERVAELTTIRQTYGEDYRFGPADNAAISPDGKWISFTLTYPADSAQCALFAVENGGTGLVRLARNIPHCFQTISSEITR